MIKPTDYHINYNKAIKFATNMTKKGVYLPIILLETAVIAGRTYQGYKRGGVVEARERVLEESTGSVIWLGGAPFICKLGNIIGKKFGGIKNPNFDIGKDTLRNPLKNVVASTPGAKLSKYAGFKLANSLISVLAAGSFLGFVVPKLNQKLTKKINQEHKKQAQAQQEQSAQNVQNTQNTQISTAEANNLPQIVIPEIAAQKAQSKFKDMDSFLNSQQNPNNKKVNFKGLQGAELIATISHNLENNASYKLLSTDAFVTTGRGYNARNADECREILFRDITSSFFYLFASPLVIKGLTALDNKSLKGNANIDPYSAMKIHNHLLDTMPKQKMTLEEFADFALGKFDEKEFKKLKFDNNGLITLDGFKKVIADTKLQEKATQMSRMQPLKDGVAHLTEKQAKDVLTSGEMTNPQFLKGVLNNIFGTLETKEDVLANPNKYIARSEIELSVEHIKDYAKSILAYAKKKNLTEITPEIMLQVNKRNLHHRIGILAAGFATAALFLSTIIPKVQYLITKIKTGSDKFPGAKNLD